MGKVTTVLVFDLGASNGRAMLCRFDGMELELEEIFRFTNEPVMRDGTLYWDWDLLFRNILEGIKQARDKGGFASIGIDTWGVDFGLLDERGELLEAPVHYRDSRTDGLSDKVAAMLGEHELYQMSGSQRIDINTLYQLYSLHMKRPGFLKGAKCLLMIPDLINYFLTGERHAELTIASTTQMLEPYGRAWNLPLLEKLGLPHEILPGLVAPGTHAGVLKGEICAELGVESVPVIAVASHDTACAVMAVPESDSDFVFISSGTWSLLGTELKEPVIDDSSRECNLTNELGFDNTVTFLKNINGLWLIQETRRQFQRDGRRYSYADMEKMARQSRPFACFIDPDSREFMQAGDIPDRIRKFCRETGQYIPESDAEVVRCIYESLAMKYRCAFEQVKHCTKKGYKIIHMVGGGTRDSFLCQMTADAVNIPVLAGPVEAAALGNAAAQLIALGLLEDMGHARTVIRKTFSPKEYLPSNPELWSRHYGQFTQAIRYHNKA